MLYICAMDRIVCKFNDIHAPLNGTHGDCEKCDEHEQCVFLE